MTTPVLALPNFNETFVVETDACSRGVDAVLLQNNHPIAFISKALGPRLHGLSTYEKECLAILMAVDKWRSYLQHAEFIIRTDQRSLMHLDDKRLSTPWQHKALTKLLGLSYKIVYKKGVENKVADALSRHIHEDTEELLVVSQCKPVWLESVTQGYLHSTLATNKLAQLTLQSPIGNYTLHKGLIRHKGRVWIGDNTYLQQDILHALYSSPIGGHSGFHATYHRVKHPFTALLVTMSYVKDIYRLHGLRLAIVSDRDPIFTNTLWQELFRLTQTELRMSSARHPETDGQTERVNQCLEGFLRCFVGSCQKQWVQWIPLAEFWYNTTIHSTLGKTPFEVMYGHTRRHIGIDVVDACEVPDLQQWLRD
jgi:hypothetical protein